MRPFALVALLVVGASCNVIRVSDSYGSYGGASLRADSYGSYGEARTFIPITSFSNDIRGSHSNQLQYATGNGISVSDNTEAVYGRGSTYEAEAGRMVQSDASLLKSGTYSFTTPEGMPISLTYRADEHGFHAEGAHLPRQVDFTPEVLAATAEHAEAHRLALSKLSSSGSYGSYDAPALFVKSSGYESAPVIRVESYDAPAPILFRSSGY